MRAIRDRALLLFVFLLGCSSDRAPAATTSSASGSASSSSSGGTGGGGSGPWRSALYPADWTPAFTDGEGRFLHDFSYAGYHNGAADPGAPAASPVLDVVAMYGADPQGNADATPSVQQAIADAEAQGGGVVSFPAGLFRFDGVLAVNGSGVVLRGAGPTQTRLYFTRSQGLSYSAHVTFTGDATVDAEVPLSQDAAPRDGSVAVDDAGDLAPGDDVAIGFVITPEFIDEHGMTGTWIAFNGQWEPFFWRTVVAVDHSVSPQRIQLDVPIRYPVKTRDSPTVRKVHAPLRECGVESLGISNAVGWDDAWAVSQVHAIQLFHTQDCWIRDVASFSSPAAPASGPGAGAHMQSSGILVMESKRVTVADTRLGLAENRGDNGNGYLFEVQRSSEILFRDDTGDSGRHNFIQNWGFGTTGCVFLRVSSANGVAMINQQDTLDLTGLSEFHHSLATANLIDSSTFDDGFSTVNRGAESTGAGHTGTENALWNLQGMGMLRSLQFKTGYVIGTRGLYVVTDSPLPMAAGTEPVDWTEGLDQGGTLTPASLYEDQLARRLGK